MPFLDEYIDKLYLNHNIGSEKYQMNLFSKSEFYKMLKPVLLLLKTKPDLTLSEYKKELYENSGFEKELRDYVLKNKSVPGLNIIYGNENYKESISIGNREEVVKIDDKIHYKSKPMEEDTIFDLASTSKVFTALSILKLCEEGKIKLSDAVTDYAPQFRNLNNLRIYDLLAFQVQLKTNKRIEECATIDEALDNLFRIEISEFTGKTYTDMGAMVLKYVIEGITNRPLSEYIKEEILEPLNMKDTTSLIGTEREKRTAPTNLGVQILKDGSFKYINEPKRGVAYDPKARKLSFAGNSFVGHAGMFSTIKDMSNLGKALINEDVVSKDSLKEASIVRTPEAVQYYGFLNFLKNDNLRQSEVHPAWSSRSISHPGWCGTLFSFDPINKMYVFIGSNRSHNRITYINPERETMLLKDENNKECIITPDGRKVIDAHDFRFERDFIRDNVVSLLFQYKFLDDILGVQKNNDEKFHRNIK